MSDNNDYEFASAENIAKCTLVLADKYDTVKLNELLECIEHRKDCNAMERVIMDTLLAHDHVTLYRRTFVDSYLFEWCKENIAHVVRHCPETLNLWANQASERAGDAVRFMAGEMERMTEGERLFLLQGQVFTQKFMGYPEAWGPRILHELLCKDARHWPELSPAWVATPELRNAAKALGWTEHDLPAMVYRNIGRYKSEDWISSVQYPYTLMACEGYRCAQNARENTPVQHIAIKCIASTSAMDFAMAKYIIGHIPNKGNMSLKRHRATKALDKETELRVEGLVQAYVALDTLQSLASDLARGVKPQMNVEDACMLPDLTESFATLEYHS
jgi:hypothetical protein